LSRHDPNHPGEEQIYDGTTKGIATEANLQQCDNDLCTAAQELVRFDLTGPWPLFHLIVLDPTSTFSCIVHITIDLLRNINIVDLFLITWALQLFGITEEQWEIVMAALMLGLDAVVATAISKGFNAALYSFMVVDSSFSLGVLSIGILCAAVTLAGAWWLGERLREQFGISVAFVFWLGIGAMVFDALNQRGKKNFNNEVQQKASDMFRFAQDRLGYSPGTKIGVSFGGFTAFFIGTMIAASLVAMMYYWNLAGS
ncbi:MAG: hypothetical protein EAX81_06465, partial [Candidatus Thorarchaeota archaeon]|nr:hypothetical protein [Candidatus Thorarchaeota archaeon]